MTVWNYITKQEVLILTEALVKLPSVPGISGRETPVAKAISDWLTERGISSEIVEVADGRSNLIATLKGSCPGKNLLLNGHLDTVPSYGMAEPFTPRIVDGKLYGRGSVDMKGPVACMLAALVAFGRIMPERQGDIVFAGVIDEEEKSLGAIHFIENLPMDFHGAIVGEPTDLEVCVAHRGLHWVEVALHGKTVHGGRQAEGLSAISLAGKFIPYIEARMAEYISQSSHPIIGKGSFNIGTITGGTQPSTVAGECVIRFDRRWLPGENLVQIFDQIQTIISDFNALHPQYKITFASMPESVMKPGYSHESMDTALDAEIVTAATRAVETVLGKTVTHTYFPAWSDGGLFSYFGGIPCVVLGPGRLESAHSDHEHIEVESLYKGVEVYVQSMLQFYSEVAFDRNAFFEDLKGLIRIPSVSDNLSETKKALRYMVDLAKKMQFTAYTVLEDQVGVVEMGKGDETVGVLVHVDVVGEGNLRDWTSPPYELTERDGKLYGRGVADDKGPAILALHVMKHLKPYEHLMHKKIQLIIGTQEEVDWTDMRAYTAAFKTPDYGFTPDGEFPITNIEKGYADVALIFDIENWGDVLTLEAGESVNSVPSYAALSFAKAYPQLMSAEHVRVTNATEQCQLEAKTVSAHSSRPMKGINAIWALTHYLKRPAEAVLLGDFLKLFKCLEDLSVDDFYGEKLGFEKGPEKLNGQQLDPTVVTPTRIFWRAPNQIAVNFNIRHSHGVTQETIGQIFERHQKDYGYRFEISNYMDFLWVDPEQPFMRVMAEAYERVTGLKNTFELAHGTSYAKAMENFIAWGPYFPGDVDSCHEVNEFLTWETLLKAGEVYSEALKALVFGTHPMR